MHLFLGMHVSFESPQYKQKHFKTLILHVSPSLASSLQGFSVCLLLAMSVIPCSRWWLVCSFTGLWHIPPGRLLKPWECFEGCKTKGSPWTALLRELPDRSQYTIAFLWKQGSCCSSSTNKPYQACGLSSTWASLSWWVTDDKQVNKMPQHSVSNNYQLLSSLRTPHIVAFLKLWLKKPHNIKFTIITICTCIVQQA